jgi:hypothetical protein
MGSFPVRFPHVLTRTFIFICLIVPLAAGLVMFSARADAGHALSFNGVNNFASLAKGSTLMGVNWPVEKTISLWLRADDTPAPVTAPASGELILGNDRPRTFGITRAVYNGLDRIWVWNVDANGLDVVGIAYEPMHWLHLAVTHDGVQLRVFVNGLQVAEIASGLTSIIPPSADGVFFLGGSGRANPDLYFGGTLDEVRFWRSVLPGATILNWHNRELTDAHPDLAALTAYFKMNAGAGTLLADDSGGSNTGLLAGGMGDSNWVVSDAFSGDLPTATPPTSATQTYTLPPQVSETPSSTATQILTNTPPATDTPVPQPSHTPTASGTATQTPTPTLLATSTPTLQPGDTPTATPILTSMPTSTPTGGNPVEIGFYDTPGAAYDLAPNGEILYVADTWGGLRVLDIRVPTAPVELSSVSTTGRLYGVATDGEYVYGADSQAGLLVFDVRDPAAPVLVGSVDPGGMAWDLAVDGDLVYLADRAGWLWIIDVSNPQQPTILSGTVTPVDTLDVVVSNGMAYLAVYYDGLQIYDVSNPFQPQQLGTYDTNSAYGVKVDGSAVYIADGGSILHVDVSQPASPVLVRSVRHDGSARSVWVNGAWLYAATWSGGVRVFDISDPGRIVQTGVYLSPDRARDIILLDGLLYVANYLSGVRILQP